LERGAGHDESERLSRSSSFWREALAMMKVNQKEDIKRRHKNWIEKYPAKKNSK
jgi:hypothetical protein